MSEINPKEAYVLLNILVNTTSEEELVKDVIKFAEIYKNSGHDEKHRIDLHFSMVKLTLKLGGLMRNEKNSFSDIIEQADKFGAAANYIKNTFDSKN